MRLEETVKLDEGHTVIVREMTVGEVKKIIKAISDIDNQNNRSLLSMLTEQFDFIEQHTTPFIEIPSKKFDDLTSSEVKKIWFKFLELNPFLDVIPKIVNTILTMSPEQLKQLISTVSPSSRGDI